MFGEEGGCCKLRSGLTLGHEAVLAGLRAVAQLIAGPGTELAVEDAGKQQQVAEQQQAADSERHSPGSSEAEHILWLVRWPCV